ncbi:terminase small subunit [Streptococcus merionis]|uniref:terminase small subunit n=1 Tax=Streptococcus merionis TaxID=400065 RepID=UPI00351679A9
MYFKNATEAARKAGYSDKTAKQISNRLLTNVDFFHVQEVIKILKENFNKRSAELSIASAVGLFATLFTYCEWLIKEKPAFWPILS